MDIELIVKKKEVMEKKLLNYVNKLFNDFKDETGLYPKDLIFDKVNVEEIGSGPITLIVECKIIVEV